jgi:hypothetical protein
VTPTALSEFFLGLAGVAYGTALFVQPTVLRDVATRLFAVPSRDLSTTEARVRRVLGVGLVVAGMYLLVFSSPV